MNVIFQDKGTDFPPTITHFNSREEAVMYILSQVSCTPPHKMEQKAVNDAQNALSVRDSFSMTEASGSQYVWTIQ